MNALIAPEEPLRRRKHAHLVGDVLGHRVEHFGTMAVAHRSERAAGLPPTDLSLDAAIVAARQRPRPTPDRIAFVAKVTALAAVLVVVVGAGHDGVVGVDDQRTGTRRHDVDGSEAVRRPGDG